MKFLVAVVLLSIAVVGTFAATDCSKIEVGATTFNLGTLPTQGPFSGADQSGQYTFSFGICQALASACPNHGGSPADVSKCDQPNTAAVCQNWSAGANQYSACCGKADMVSYSAYSSGADNGLTLTYGNGDDCSICSPEARSTAINLVCDPTVAWGTAPKVTSIQPAQPPSPVYTITIRHVAGCAVGAPGYSAPSGGISPGSVLLIITIVGFVVYVIVGCIINKFVRHQEGSAIFPNSEFWGGLPGLVKDGFMFIIHKCRGTTPNTYRPVEG